MPTREPVIVGIGLSDLPRAPHLDPLGHQAVALARALEDCGLPHGSVDGLMSAGMGGAVSNVVTVAEYLGLNPRVMDGTNPGGSAAEHFVMHAAEAIAAGRCDTVAITYGSDLLSGAGRALGTGSYGQTDGPVQYEVPYGSIIAACYAMGARRHMHEYGTTSAQLAEVAVACRRHASLNPNAKYRDLITVEDVLASRMVADPLHLLDCCVVSDGGGAVIMTTADRAKDLRQKPVHLLGAATAQTHWQIAEMSDLTTTGAARSGPEAFAQAGVEPEDIHTVQLYDGYTYTVLALLEDLGFCKKGEGGPFVEGGRLQLGGDLPVNTDGGGLSACHPGMRGIFLVIEAVRQLRGNAGEAQVSDCELALVCGVGGLLSNVATLILGGDR